MESARPVFKPFRSSTIQQNLGGSKCLASASSGRVQCVNRRPTAWFATTLRARQSPCPVPPAVPSSLASKPRLSYVGHAVAGSGDGISHDKNTYGSRIEEATGGVLRPPPISRPDTEFETKLAVQFVEGREGILITELNELFEKVGFPRRDPDRLKVALENTYHIIWVRATKQSRLARQGQLLGFARATSDGVLSATVWDVAVNPAWQRSGLGRALMERLTKKLVDDGIPTITLYAEPQARTWWWVCMRSWATSVTRTASAAWPSSAARRRRAGCSLACRDAGTRV